VEKTNRAFKIITDIIRRESDNDLDKLKAILRLPASPEAAMGFLLTYGLLDEAQFDCLTHILWLPLLAPGIMFRWSGDAFVSYP
jgi:hypothetical protein